MYFLFGCLDPDPWAFCQMRQGHQAIAAGETPAAGFAYLKLLRDTANTIEMLKAKRPISNMEHPIWFYVLNYKIIKLPLSVAKKNQVRLMIRY